MLFRSTDNRIKILDFGIANVLDSVHSSTRPGIVVGTQALVCGDVTGQHVPEEVLHLVEELVAVLGERHVPVDLLDEVAPDLPLAEALEPRGARPLSGRRLPPARPRLDRREDRARREHQKGTVPCARRREARGG